MKLGLKWRHILLNYLSYLSMRYATHLYSNVFHPTQAWCYISINYVKLTSVIKNLEIEILENVIYLEKKTPAFLVASAFIFGC